MLLLVVTLIVFTILALALAAEYVSSLAPAPATLTSDGLNVEPIEAFRQHCANMAAQDDAGFAEVLDDEPAKAPSHVQPHPTVPGWSIDMAKTPAQMEAETEYLGLPADGIEAYRNTLRPSFSSYTTLVCDQI